jgi:hypothetical protein
MKDFSVYYCDNDHTNYLEIGKEKHKCKICGLPLRKIFGITVRAESEDELSRQSSYDSSSESLLSARITGN